MNIDWFTLPFVAGVVFLIIALAYKYTRWLKQLHMTDYVKLIRHILHWKIFLSIRDMITEGLLHRKIFRVNLLLGFMHTSLAFGWFLLIVTGFIETRFHHIGQIEMPYDAIFFRYFVHDVSTIQHGQLFSFIMDLILAIILTGISLALIKRFVSIAFGMKRRTRYRNMDRLAITSLWLIFPLRSPTTYILQCTSVTSALCLAPYIFGAEFLDW